MSNTSEQPVSRLQEIADLSTSQIARLFDVSPRIVHAWLQGDDMSTAQQERCAHLVSVILPLGESPAERRRALLSSSDGMSIFHQLISELGDEEIISPKPFTARDCLGA